jgi:NTE family protein
MLFHAGALWRLNHSGLLGKLDRISSVSGGSIAAGLLWLKWQEMGLDKRSSAPEELFVEHFITLLRALARKTVDVPAMLGAIFKVRPAANTVTAAYRKHLYGDILLKDLPSSPRFVINATNLQSGVLCRFTQAFIWDWRVGQVPEPEIPLAVAVAASSAFPPILSPATLRFREEQFKRGTGADLQTSDYRTRMLLTDGGVYDNLGLEAVKGCYQVLVSDGGGKMRPEPRPWLSWAYQAIQINSIIDNQVRSLRKRMLIDSFRRGERKGTYWSIRSDLVDYHLTDALPFPSELSARLALVPTRLARVSDELQENLMNWGYVICDAAIRKHIDPRLPAPSRMPFPMSDIGSQLV